MCIKGQTTYKKKKQHIKDTFNNLRASEWGRKGTEVTLANMVVGAVLRTYWDFCDNATTSGDYREQSQKEKIASVCSSCAVKNTLMMSEVRRGWPEWLEATERQHNQPVTTKTCRKATLPTLPGLLSPANSLRNLALARCC